MGKFMTINDAERESARSREVMRLLQLTRDEAVDNLLSSALAGREPTVASVTKLWNFVLSVFPITGLTPSTVARKYWAASSGFFKEAGLTPQQIENIQHPFPTASEPGFISVLSEMHDEGLD
jgi:hypothetical protein